MRLNKLLEKIWYFVLVILVGATVLTGEVKSQDGTCKSGSISYTCPDGFEKLPNVDDTTSLFKFQYKDTILYFFVANPSGKFDPNSVMNAIAGYYPGGPAAPFRWKEMKETSMMSMRSQQEKQVGSWLGYDGKHLINLKSAVFKINDKTVVFGYAWDWGDKAGNKQDKFKKADDLGDQSFGCNALATTLNSVTREFPQGRQYCYMSSMSIDK